MDKSNNFSEKALHDSILRHIFNLIFDYSLMQKKTLHSFRQFFMLCYHRKTLICKDDDSWINPPLPRSFHLCITIENPNIWSISHCFLPTCWWYVFSVGRVADQFKLLGLVCFESTGRGEGTRRRLKLGTVPQSCGELRFCCSPRGSHGKVLKHSPSLCFKILLA